MGEPIRSSVHECAWVCGALVGARGGRPAADHHWKGRGLPRELGAETSEEDVDPLAWRVLLQGGTARASIRRHFLQESRLNTFDEWVGQQDSGYWEIFTTKQIVPGSLANAIHNKDEEALFRFRMSWRQGRDLARFRMLSSGGDCP